MQSIINDMEADEFFTKKQLEDDFKNFSGSLLAVLNKNKRPSNDYIYGRDLDSVSWYCKIFANETETIDKLIARCDDINIITSKFDWAGLNNKHTRTAVRYYEDLQLTLGEFYTLVTPEIYGDGFSIEDIDEMEKIILSHLKSPITIGSLFNFMLQYVEDDIIKNHLDDYKVLFLEMLKQLILKKAIMPARNTTPSFV